MYNKFVVPKKNRNDFKSINFEVLINLTTNEFKILKIANFIKNRKIRKIADLLIYSYPMDGNENKSKLFRFWIVLDLNESLKTSFILNSI